MQAQNRIAVIVIGWRRQFVKYAVSCGDIKVAATVDCWRSASGPDSAVGSVYAIWGSVQDRHLLLHIRCFVCEHPPVIRRGIFVGREGDVNSPTVLRQARSVVLQLGIEMNYSID